MAALAEKLAGKAPEPDSRIELLRFTTAGSVDDGKSTLIGRLLYDSQNIYEDQLAGVRKATRNLNTNGLDLSLLTDGLRAEREQGITIDVAYRYFATPRRKFIIADTPGHEQYTRNMATGASTAGLAVVLIDARQGVLPQSRRHAYIARLLGIPHLAVAVNKMDLVDFREDVFRAIAADFQAFARRLGLREIVFLPISALDGDNVVLRSPRTPWYNGPSLLEHLETVPLDGGSNHADFRFPVQYVIRPDLNFRGYAGQVASGVIRSGDEVAVLPSGRVTRVRAISTWDGELQEAFAPMSVTLCLDDHVDVSRGDMLVHPSAMPRPSRRFLADLVWMHQSPLALHRPYILKHTTQTMHARVRAVVSRLDIHSLRENPAQTLELNDIGTIELETQRPLFADPYETNRATGSFILIDAVSNETLAAGMIREAAEAEDNAGRVTPEEREAARGHRALAVCLSPDGLDFAYALERRLFDLGYTVQLIENPEHPPTAVATALAAGTIALFLGEATDLGETVPPERLVRVVADASDLESATRHIATLAGRIQGIS